MQINLSRAHVLTQRDNKKLYEVAEILRLQRMIDGARAERMQKQLSQELCTEQAYREACLACEPKKTKPVKVHEVVSYDGKKAIVNAHTQTLYILPHDFKFITGSKYDSFSHDKLSQLSTVSQEIIKADLRASDILRYEVVNKASQHYYKVIELCQ